MNNDSNRATEKLVSAKKLLELLWDEESRPSLRWLRELTKKRMVPYHKIGALVFFDPVAVRQAINSLWRIDAKSSR